MLKELTTDQLKDMDIASLVQRMDEVRIHALEERYGKDFLNSSRSFSAYPLVSQFMATKAIANKNDETQRKLADCAFRFLLQMDLLSVSSGISNDVLYGPSYSEESWKSPKYWMKSAVLKQYSIVASRIALECFFDLIYMADLGKRMDGDSKFKEFKKWILKDKNPFIYFVGHIIKAFEFDRTHRQKEVHGTSRFARSLLTLHKPDFSESNIHHQLTNVLLKIWQPLLQILDGQKPTSISVFDSCDSFATKYFESHSDPNSFVEFIRALMSDKMQ